MDQGDHDPNGSSNQDFEKGSESTQGYQANDTTASSYPRQAVWNECSGFGTGFTWVGEHDRFSPPPEWDPSPVGQHAADVFVDAVECERFSLGPFERPVKVVIDQVGITDVPDSCWRDDVTIRFTTLQSVWFNDTEIVDYLRDTYNMPAYYAEVENEWEAVGPTDEREFHWVMTQENGSRMYFVTPEVTHTDHWPGLHYRIFWFNDTALSYMDWSIDVESSNSMTYGEPKSPMSLADWHTDQYLQFGGITSSLEGKGEIAMFRDKLCLDEIE